ncbi:hypothetical protein PPBDW_I21494 [Photobacterium kishitanii]|nr:hypothetical protein PPBDW_I21494 [Photobacterium kishitanii]
MTFRLLLHLIPSFRLNIYYLIIELTRLIIIHQAFKNTTIITDKIRIDYYIKIINH